eukprot:337138_1
MPCAILIALLLVCDARISVSKAGVKINNNLFVKKNLEVDGTVGSLCGSSRTYLCTVKQDTEGLTTSLAQLQQDTQNLATALAQMQSQLNPTSCKQLAKAFKSGDYLMADGRVHYCDMRTAGGGWTVLGSWSGADNEKRLTDNVRVTGNPFYFQHYALTWAEKSAMSAGATEMVLVRSTGEWLKVVGFGEFTFASSTTYIKDAIAQPSVGDPVAVKVGYSTKAASGGGDFGITTTSFDQHSTTYPLLNAGCKNQLLYSYSSSTKDWDPSYKASISQGDWGADVACSRQEGSPVKFYLAVR